MTMRFKGSGPTDTHPDTRPDTHIGPAPFAGFRDRTASFPAGEDEVLDPNPAPSPAEAAAPSPTAPAPAACTVAVGAPPLQVSLDASPLSLDDFLQLVWDRHNIDLRWYRRSTVDRRLGRRLMQLGIPSLGQYMPYLDATPAEREHLRALVRIRVTEFFRDAPAWQAVRNDVLPGLLQKKTPARPLRAWVAGCSTGEEAYSLAILLADVSHGQTSDIQLFATDIDQEALRVARRGEYGPEALRSVPTRLRERYFRGEPIQQIDPAIRQMLVFGEADLLRSPHFSHLDLIVCRNVLIYFEEAKRSLVLGKFYLALREGGMLWLGNTESGLVSDARLVSLYPRWRIFIKPESQPLAPSGVSTPQDAMTSSHLTLNPTLANRAIAPQRSAPLTVSPVGTIVQLEDPIPQGRLEDKREGRGSMRMVNERLESALQELQATNETLAATNEELKTLNEELERMNEELEQRARELRQLSESYSATLEQMPCPVVLVDRSGKIQMWNSAAHRVFSLAPASVLGLEVSQLPLQPTFRQALLRKYRSVAERATPAVLKNQALQVNRIMQRFNVHLAAVNRDTPEEGVLIVFLPQIASSSVVSVQEGHKFMEGTAI